MFHTKSNRAERDAGRERQGISSAFASSSVIHATAVLFVPIAMTAALSIDVNKHAFLIAVAVEGRVCHLQRLWLPLQTRCS
ncbi:hypothetical protein SporoP37_09285 [Sporosarcina sp. P37]|nr:hypothetical protein SporoP33_08895 [Sporosarcina sp. P33]ARK24839.1 hypothetical protein SporoP37_09285 [Sporosarcina sp. P37]PID19999.1 hypothetical protein CSV62_01820 [Sporosarcina sp. P35]